MSNGGKTVGAIGAVTALLGLGPCALRESGSVLVGSRTAIESSSSFAGRTTVRPGYLSSSAVDLRSIPLIEPVTAAREIALVPMTKLAIAPPVEFRVISVAEPMRDIPTSSAVLGHEVGSQSASQKVGMLFSQAEPRIIDDLISLDGNLSQSKVADVIGSDVAKTLQNNPTASEAGVTFEVLSGKLKFNSYRTVHGAKISLGEVNVYKVSFVLAGTVVACASLGASELTSCVKEALATAGDVVRKQMELNTKTAKPLCRQISKKHRAAAKNSGACVERPAPEARHEQSRKTAAKMPIKQ